MSVNNTDPNELEPWSDFHARSFEHAADEAAETTGSSYVSHDDDEGTVTVEVNGDNRKMTTDDDGFPVFVD